MIDYLKRQYEALKFWWQFRRYPHSDRALLRRIATIDDRINNRQRIDKC